MYYTCVDKHFFLELQRKSGNFQHKLFFSQAEIYIKLVIT